MINKDVLLSNVSELPEEDALHHPGLEQYDCLADPGGCDENPYKDTSMSDIDAMEHHQGWNQVCQDGSLMRIPPIGQRGHLLENWYKRRRLSGKQ